MPTEGKVSGEQHSLRGEMQLVLIPGVGSQCSAQNCQLPLHRVVDGDGAVQLARDSLQNQSGGT